MVNSFPLRIERDDAVFYLSNHAVPRPIQLSSGYLDENTAQNLRDWSDLDKDKFKVAVGHYPLLTEEGEELPTRKLLVEGKKALKLLQSGAIDLNLCGHIHRAFLRQESCGSREICAGSLTMGRKANIFEIDRGKFEQKWKIF